MRFVLFLLVVVVVMPGCAESTSSAATDKTAVVDGSVVSTERIPIEPEDTQVRMWLCSGGLVFDDEFCGSRHDRKTKEFSSIIAERYPGFTITKVERTQEEFNGTPYTVYYFTIKKPIASPSP